MQLSLTAICSPKIRFAITIDLHQIPLIEHPQLGQISKAYNESYYKILSKRQTLNCFLKIPRSFKKTTEIRLKSHIVVDDE